VDTDASPAAEAAVAAWRAQATTHPVDAAHAAWSRIVELQELGRSDRKQAAALLDALFRAGSPARGLDGPTDGILVLTTTTALTDAAFKALTSVWMPWEGKRFDADAQTGDNRMTDEATVVSKVLWPLYSMKDTPAGKTAFDFTTYVEPGEDDPDIEVMVIDYADIKDNPRLLIRSIRDELVELVDGAYLGKILYRLPTEAPTRCSATSPSAPLTARPYAAVHVVRARPVLPARPARSTMSPKIPNPLNLQWYQHPSLLLQLNALANERDDLREKNLFEGEGIRPEGDMGEPTPEVERARTPEGTYNDLGCPHMGAKGTGFGRNVPIEKTVIIDRKRLLTPDPREISRKLMARDTFKPAGILNALGAAWLQFENHNWFFHGNGVADRTINIPLQPGDDFPENPMRIRETIPLRRRDQGRLPGPVFANEETHWWDGSQIYGSARRSRARSAPSSTARSRSTTNGRLPTSDIPGVDLTGMQENWWFGPGLLHTLFAREHNSVVAAIKKAHPDYSDQRLFELGVLVVSALIAKIHTVEWTPCVLRHPALQIGMSANWYGALGEAFKDKIGRVGDSEALRHHRLRDRPPRGAVLADRGVRVGLPDAPADPRRLVLLLPRVRPPPPGRVLHRPPGPLHPRLHGQR
jgi:hypothetical protein